MSQPQTNWNDDRLDHLSKQVDALRGHMDERFARLDDRFDRLQGAIIVTLAGMLAAFGGALFALHP